MFAGQLVGSAVGWLPLHGTGGGQIGQLAGLFALRQVKLVHSSSSADAKSMWATHCRIEHQLKRLFKTMWHNCLRT
jgi:hypothetical protein